MVTARYSSPAKEIPISQEIFRMTDGMRPAAKKGGGNALSLICGLPGGNGPGRHRHRLSPQGHAYGFLDAMLDQEKLACAPLDAAAAGIDPHPWQSSGRVTAPRYVDPSAPGSISIAAPTGSAASGPLSPSGSIEAARVDRRAELSAIMPSVPRTAPPRPRRRTRSGPTAPSARGAWPARRRADMPLRRDWR